MTIAISLKVHDGVVLVADSASTLVGTAPDGTTAVINIYNNANKLFNLHRELPVGGVTWGAGAVGPASITTLSKDLRKRFMGLDPVHIDWKLDPATYTLRDVVERVRAFFYDEHYEEARRRDAKTVGPFGLIVAGFSAGEALAEEWEFGIEPDGSCAPPHCIRSGDACGVSPRGQPEAVIRLYSGMGGTMRSALVDVGMPAEQIEPFMTAMRPRLQAPLLASAMPIQDLIDLGVFLADAAVSFSRFTPGASTVGGPIEVAAITKHEGFKWVRRKHYYDARFNPSRS